MELSTPSSPPSQRVLTPVPISTSQGAPATHASGRDFPAAFFFISIILVAFYACGNRLSTAGPPCRGRWGEVGDRRPSLSRSFNTRHWRGPRRRVILGQGPKPGTWRLAPFSGSSSGEGMEEAACRGSCRRERVSRNFCCSASQALTWNRMAIPLISETCQADTEARGRESEPREWLKLVPSNLPREIPVPRGRDTRCCELGGGGSAWRQGDRPAPSSSRLPGAPHGPHPGRADLCSSCGRVSTSSRLETLEVKPRVTDPSNGAS